MPERDFNGWLEDVIKQLYDVDLDCMGFVMRTKDGEIMTSYFNTSAEDMAVFVHNINIDIMYSVMRNNKEYLKEILEEDEEEHDTL